VYWVRISLSTGAVISLVDAAVPAGKKEVFDVQHYDAVSY